MKVGDFERYVDEIAWRRKINNVVVEWKENIFGPRGLNVIPDLPVKSIAKHSQVSGTTN
jgi:hypothetical protein